MEIGTKVSSPLENISEWMLGVQPDPRSDPDYWITAGSEYFKSGIETRSYLRFPGSPRVPILLYSDGLRPYAWVPMLMIAAAMGEELKTAVGLCGSQKTITHRSVSLRQAVRNDQPILFLRAGVGPRRSAASLDAALNAVEVTRILVIGYAGALSPDLRLGDLVAVRRALAVRLDKADPGWDSVQLEGTFELMQSDELARSAHSAGLRAEIGDVLTSPYVLGDPVHKKLLHDQFRASIVDMETAALARVAASRNVPLCCIRVISDEARDTFLEPFSHDPATGIAARAGKLLSNGMVQTLRDWKSHTRVANSSLTQFLERYL